MRSVVLAHAATTLAMAGLMWSVQVVIYPQFRSVDPANFSAYVTEHSHRIVRALALFAPLEVALAGWLFIDTPAELHRTAVFVAGLLLAAGWVATAVFFAPLHARLQTSSYDVSRIERLIRTNWIRTGLWFGRAGFAIWFVWDVIDR